MNVAIMKFLRTRWKIFLAYFRLSLDAVCEQSVDGRDYHDYHDDKYKHPTHFATLICERCGKAFTI